MKKTTFKISGMDCPSEEQMIRMKLAEQANIRSLDFDIPGRRLTVYHTDDYQQIHRELDSLKLGTSLVDSVPHKGSISDNSNTKLERKILWYVLLINFAFFVIELTTGFISGSMGLVADSLDMLADSIVYALALFAVGGTLTLKKNIAKAAGYFQLLLAMLGFSEVIRRFIRIDEVPDFKTMIIVSVLALFANVYCLFLLRKSKSKEAHMQATMIFTSNDIVINLGVILAGVLVFITNTKYPDLIVGTAVFFIVARGAIKILKLSK